MSKASKFLQPLASAAIFYYATLWLVVLVVVGTISQKYFGLQASLETYFSAWFVQPMDMPLWLPSGRFTMSIIILNLLAKMLVATKWKWKMVGINLTHLGVLLLMIGGIITAFTTTEGNLALQEGETASSFSDFHKVELAVTDTSHKDYDEVTVFTDGFFTDQQSFSDSETPLKFKVTQFYKNCKLITRTTPNIRYKRQAKRVELKELPSNKEDQNLTGIEVEISGAKEEFNGTYIFLNSPQWGAAQIIGSDKKTYLITLRPRNYALPFSLTLKDFEKLDHAGTMTARAYSSKVTVTDNGSSENIKIYMNHPLRKGGYTLYQASFSQNNPSGLETSVFQVVHNKGRHIPYIAIFIITAGLLLHVFIQVPKLIAASQSRS